MNVKYIGSCADDSRGIGELIKGVDYRYHQNTIFEILTEQNEWVECYDVVKLSVLPQGSVDVEYMSIDPK